MKKTLELYKKEFESNSGLTPQLKNFSMTFKREFKALLKELGAVEININKGHFHLSGFFKLKDERIYYFSLSDVRSFKGSMLIRTATDFKDYTGGSNNDINFNEDIEENLKTFLSQNG